MAYDSTRYGADLTPTVLKTPATGPRRNMGVMKDEELQSLFNGLVSAARQYIQNDISPERAKATKYYHGEPFGTEQKGRSQFVATPVRDNIRAVVPSLVRMIFGPEAPVEFRARRQDAVDGARQATDYVRYCFEEENDGFLQTIDNINDGMIRRHGIWKWGWDDTPEYHQELFQGTQEELTELLAADDTLELSTAGDVDPKTGQMTAELKRTISEGRCWICCVPPEEFIAVRESRSLRDTIGVFHQTRKTRGELIEMGVPEAVIEEFGGDDPSIRDDELALVREPTGTTGPDTDAGKANERILYVEGYVRLDYDGDGVAELRCICGIGPTFHVLDGEKFNYPCDEIPFSVWSPEPEAHSLMGGHSWADLLMDMQRLESQLYRSTLDSLSSAIFPRKWYKEGDANLADILSTQVGAPIRTRSGPNAVGEFGHTFVGKEALPIIQLCYDTVERRTGVEKGAQGLDADALQSTTAAGVTAAVSAAQAQQELLARIYAELSLKPMFKGVLRLFTKYKPRLRTVKLRGEWIQPDPTQWDPTMDVTVNVMMGSGLVEQKLQTLFDIKTAQEQILQTLGPNNPIVNLKQYRDTLAMMIELRGFKDSARFFQPITDQQIQQMQQAAQNAPPPPDPKMIEAQGKIQVAVQTAQAKAQADMAKMQMDAELARQKAAAEVEREHMEAQLSAQLEAQKAQVQADLQARQLAVETQKAQLEDDRVRDKNAADVQLALLEMELKYGVSLADIQIDAQIERERMATQAAGEDAKRQSTEKMHGDKLASAERVADKSNATTEKVAAGKNKTTEKVASNRPAAKVRPPRSGPKKRSFTVTRGQDGKINGGTIEDSE